MQGWRVFAGVRSVPSPPEGDTEWVELDITEPASIARARDRIAAELGDAGLDALVNNAGISVDGPLELVPLEALRRQFEVNVVGQIAVTQAFLPFLRKGRGRIVNLGGAAGRSPLPMYGALSGSKAALDALSESLRMELKHQGVSVSYVEPGGAATSFFKTSAAAARDRGYAGDTDTQKIYEQAIESSARALAKAPTSPVEELTKAIERALSARRPAARYRVGRQARFLLPILRCLPTGVRDRLVMSSLDLGPSAFATPTRANRATAASRRPS
jgi:NAD(P)-dependent dehydrogenase (short-subunit alcohol dehydrogenase family)